MTKKMLIDAAHEEEVRVCVMENGKVEDFDFESQARKPLRGNIYLARVTRVEPSLQAAFVEFGGNRHGFLAFNEIHPDYYQIPISDRQALQQAEADEARLAEELERFQRDDEDDDETGLIDEEARTGVDLDDDLDTPLDDDDTADVEAANVDDDADDAEELTSGDDVEDQDADESDAAPETDAPEAPEDTSDDLAATAASEDDAEAVDDAEETSVTADQDAAADASNDQTGEDDADNATPEGGAALASAPQPSLAMPAPVALDDNEAETQADADATTDASGAEEDASDDDAVEDSDSAEDSDPAGLDASAEDVDQDDVDAQEKPEPSKAGAAAKARRAEREALYERYKEARRNRARILRNYKIQEVIKRRQILLVQVVKEERGNKGAALTSYISLAGRYCVLMPNTARGGGISRKIPNASDRKRLRRVVDSLDVAEGMGLIIRTAGAKRTKTEIKRDYDYLTRLWENIRALTLESIAPCLIYEEASLIKRAIRDLYDKEISTIQVEGEDGYREAKDFMKMLMPSHAKNVQPYKDRLPIFTRFDVETQLDAMYQPVVRLKSGGYIVINQTEALIAVDVNSGKATRERNIELTALKTNLEAAVETARQCRMRDLAGLIVIDFIDMEESKNNRAVEKKFKEAVKHDRARIQVGRISNFGLLEMSRQRRRSGIVDGTTHICPTCNGAGAVRSHEMAALRLLRALESEAIAGRAAVIAVKASLDVALYVLNNKRKWIGEIEREHALAIEIEPDVSKAGDQFEIEKRGAPAPLEDRTSIVRADTIEIITDNDDDAEAAPAEARERSDDATEDSDEKSGEDRPRKRRRRRRKKRDENAADGDENAVSADDADAASSDAAADGSSDDAGEQSGEETAQAGEDDEGGERKKRRRRGRRGGRRKSRREGEEAANGADGAQTEGPQSDAEMSAETSASDAQASEADETAASDPDAEASDAPAASEAEPAELEAKADIPSVETPATETTREDDDAEPRADGDQSLAFTDPAPEEDIAVPQEAAPTAEEIAERLKNRKTTRKGWWSRAFGG